MKDARDARDPIADSAASASEQSTPTTINGVSPLAKCNRLRVNISNDRKIAWCFLSSQLDDVYPKGQPRTARSSRAAMAAHSDKLASFLAPASGAFVLLGLE